MKLFKMVIALVAVAAMAVSGANAEGMGNGMKKGMKMPKNYRMVPMAKAQILQKGDAKMYCPKCGMTLPMFYRTNHAATVDGKVEQFCSIHCMVEEMKSGKKVTDVKVVDNSTLKFIDASKAYYVVGSKKPGTMSKVSKYAFGTKEAAEKFASEFGGKVEMYNDVLQMVENSFDKEAKMVAMNQAKAAKKGEMIYKKKCKPIDQKFTTAAEAKAYVKANNVCGDIKGKPLQAVGLYLKSR